MNCAIAQVAQISSAQNLDIHIGVRPINYQEFGSVLNMGERFPMFPNEGKET